MRILPITLGALGVLMFAGCNDSGSDSGSSGANQPVYDGSATEFSGYFTYITTASSGLYKDAWYCPKGLTGNVWIENGDVGEVEVYFYNTGSTTSRSVYLTADPATKTYVGTSTYNDSTNGAYNGKWIDETWTLSFAGPVATLSVDAQIDEDDTNNYASGVVGKTSLALSNPIAFNYFDSSYFYGKTTSFSSDSRYVGQTSALELDGWDPGYYGYLWIDGTFNWNDAFYFDAAIRDGNTLIAGGFYDGSYGDNSDWTEAFFTVAISLDAAGQPVASTLRIIDIDDDTDDGAALGTVTTVSTANYQSETRLENTVSNTSGTYQYDITVDSVSSTGSLNLMATEALTGDYVTTRGSYWYLSTFGSLYGGYVANGQRIYVLWDGNQYRDGGQPSYDLDNDSDTMERFTIKFNLDADGEPTGGTIILQVYDLTTDALTETETLVFSLTQTSST